MWHRRNREGPERQDREAEHRLNDARKLAAQSRVVTARLRREVDKNGWTELLQEAWARR